MSPENTHPKPPSEAPAALKCPRCHSPDTKFCYYNNYTLTQPRHFCKTCRRYWTHGGALRYVPVGGACRKYKKAAKSGSSNSDIGRLDFLNGASSVQLDRNSPFSSVACMSDQIGNFSVEKQRSSNFLIPSSTNGFNSLNLASSIETLSSNNQPKLAMIFGEDNTAIEKNRGINFSPIAVEDRYQELITSSVWNLGISKRENCNSSDFNYARKQIVAGTVAGAGGDSAVADEWLFGDSYDATLITGPTMGSAAAGYNSGDSAAWYDGGQEYWHDLNQYNHLP